MSNCRSIEINVSKNWWENCSVITRVSAKANNITLKQITSSLDEMKAWGIDAIEVFAPYHGGIEYSGLDAVDFYSVDPSIGTMEDFMELVRCCHQKGLSIIAFMNLGYSAEKFPAFLKACDDTRNGISSEESRWFLWSDTGKDSFDKSLAPYFMNDTEGHWHYSDRADKYYWVKWKGINGEAELPQFNFGAPEWQKECKRIIKFWMDTGIDGMIIDAVNWYMNCNWELNNEIMTDIIAVYQDKYVQPEGAGGFKDDPVRWITDGRYNSVQDYGMNIWWSDHDVVGKAIDTGNPDGIEAALNNYRDRVVAAGGITYIGPYWDKTVTYDQRLLEIATLATVGELFHDDNSIIDLNWPLEYKEKLKKLLCTKSKYTCLMAAGDRKKIRTNDDNMYYAFIKFSKDMDQKALVVLNFQNESRKITVNLEQKLNLSNILTNEKVLCNETLNIVLSAFGYEIFLISEIDMV